MLSFAMSGSSALSGTSITDYTPAATTNQSVGTATISNTLTVANAGDLVTGTLSAQDGRTSGNPLSQITLAAGNDLHQIADAFNGITESDNGNSNATNVGKLENLGITASLNTVAIGTLGQAGYQAIGTVMTLTQTATDLGAANVITNTGTSDALTDTISAANPTQTENLVTGAGLHANTLSVATAGDTMTGTLKVTEGVDTNSTNSYLNLNGQTLAQIAADFNTTTGKVNLSNAGITAVLNNATPSLATSIAFIANAGEAGALNATVVNSTAIVDQGAAVPTAISVGAGTMLDTLSVNNKSDILGGSLTVTPGTTGVAAPAINLGTSGTTDTLANLAAQFATGGQYSTYGITATLNQAGNQLTFTQTSGDSFAAVVSGTSVTDSGTTSLTNNGNNLGTLTANQATDTMTGTLNIVGANGSTSYTLQVDGKTLSQLASTINSNSSYGITATLDKTGTELSFAATTGDSGTPSINNYGNMVDTTVANQTAVTLADVPTKGAANSSTLGSVSIGSTETLSGSVTIGGQTINIGSSDNTAATLASSINLGNYGVQAAYNANSGQLTFTSPNSAMGVSTTSLDETAPGSTTSTAVGSLTGASTSSNYYSTGITGTVADTSTKGGTANVGITSDANGSSGTATISYTDAAGQALNTTSLSNQAVAETALTDLNTAITDVAAQDGYIGAQINTLNSVSSVLSTQAENVTAAQNAVQATDYASAASNMSKYEILSQTGISALAQANSIQQEVTKLLQ